MAEPTELKYRAFISYSHADTSWAKWLHRGLEGFHIDKDLVGRETSAGTIPKELRPIFRDREDFSPGRALSEQTLAALDGSRALLVICSPASAKSFYVNEEARLFQSRHPDRLVIPLIVAGRPGNSELECFPPSLKFKLDEGGNITSEPQQLLAADAQAEGDGKSLALAKLAAELLGLTPDEVFRRAERERRSAMRRKRRAQVLFGLLAFAVLAGVIGWVNEAYLQERWRWFTTIRPYMMAKVRPHVLTAEAQQALKPGDTFRECAKDCPEMLVVPAGAFTMGSPEGEGEDGEHPQHEVTFVKPFAVSKFEVTFDDWDACVTYGDCPHTSDSFFGRGRRPLINVSWFDAKRYVAWLSRMTGKTYRLLSEAEWEYSARAGSMTRFFFGDDVAKLGEYAWYNENSDYSTQPVGKKSPNPFGLYDIYGNVAEWTEDTWHRNYKGSPSDGSAWIEGRHERRHVLRGGSWNYYPIDLRSAKRFEDKSSLQSEYIGFRVGRTLHP